MKVSIITPCLNSEKTIRDTLESVLNQTYKNIEYIVVDGGSTDGTLEIIKEYLPQFSGRMKYVSEKDRGIYDAMNKGIKMSHGTLIGIINSDDYYELNAVENVVSHMSNDVYQVIYGYCRLIGKRCRLNIVKTGHADIAESMIPHPTCFVTRKTYCDFGMFLTAFKIANDYELMVRLLKTEKVTFLQIKQVIANFRLGGVCSNIRRAEMENAIIAYYHGIISFRKMILRLIDSTWMEKD